MKTKKHTWILYLIVITIIATISVQFYWNFKNYEENRQRVTNEIQLSLDNAIEEYYSSLAKSNFLTIVSAKYNDDATPLKDTFINKLLNKTKKTASKNEKPKITINNIKITSDENVSKEKVDSMMNSTKEFITKFNTKVDPSNRKRADSIKVMTQFTDKKNGYTLHRDGTRKVIQYFRGKKAADSLKLSTNLEPIFISFLDQSVEYKKIDSLIENQLKKKGIRLKTSFHHHKNDTLFHQTKDSVLNSETFLVSSKSTFVRENEAFQLVYNNTSLEAFKRSFTGILLSFLLSLIIIFSLFFLLKVINQQKELAAIKNDLISNITHEFKTPIATVSTAIEAIENFNALDDREKTKKYLSMSSLQLKKLHLMVEKLLETATLDSEQLLLQKEEYNIVELIDKLAQKHQHLTTEKKIHFSTNTGFIDVTIDVFHFENAVSNLIDNAIKYGGDKIEITINAILNHIEITVADNGNGIEKNQQEKIFEKFYRVPKGNTHDVKGFGIGLYYTKKIIEKHNGTIQLLSHLKNTLFKITLPNE